jgi:hypothetical protein
MLNPRMSSNLYFRKEELRGINYVLLNGRIIMKSIFFRWILPFSIWCTILTITNQYVHNSSWIAVIWFYIGMVNVHYQQFLDKKLDKTSQE